MENHEQATDLLDTTMVTLSNDVTDLTPQSGKGVIDRWISTLQKSGNTRELVELLESLKTQLESGSTNPAEVQQILLDLANHTHQMVANVGAEGDISSRLEVLAAALQNTAGQLANA